MTSRVCVVAAGGTGGHMFPAEALARELTRRGWRIVLATDHRGEAYAQAFPAEERIALDAATGRGPIGMARAGVAIARGLFKARKALKRLDAAVVVGFGGYPSAPALLAALSQGRPTLLHEQNSVLGRTNRWLSPYVGAVAASFPNLRLVPPGVEARVGLIGNPVRPDIRTLFDRPYAAPKARGPIHVLVTGGSQGASVLSQVVPDGLSLLPVSFRRRLQVTHQARIEDIDAARAKYAELSIAADLATYLPDLPEHLAWAHLVIARAGASTLSELTCAGRPAILVPLPSATDDHQTVNAREMTAAGGARTIDQRNFTPVELAKQMQRLGLDPSALQNAAARARSCGRPDAARDLADLVESLAETGGDIPVGLAQPTTTKNGLAFA